MIQGGRIILNAREELREIYPDNKDGMSIKTRAAEQAYNNGQDFMYPFG